MKELKINPKDLKGNRKNAIFLTPVPPSKKKNKPHRIKWFLTLIIQMFKIRWVSLTD